MRPDVFADILNVLLFDGKQVVRPEELFDVGLRSQFKADTGREHEQERDVAKYWIRDGKILAMFGLENQTNTDYDMPMRIFSYDGSSYKSQLMRAAKEAQGDARYPIITLVLYFGEKHWGEQSVSLKGMFNGPDELQKYMQNVRRKESGLWDATYRKHGWIWEEKREEKRESEKESRRTVKK